MLVSENPKYRPMIYTEDTCEDLRVLGKAVAYQHSLECGETDTSGSHNETDNY